MITKFVVTIAAATLLILGSSCAPPYPPGSNPPPSRNTPTRTIIEPKLENPYQNYEYWYKGQTHTHTKSGPDEKGGECRLAVIDVIDLYNQAGYDFLAITDHNTVGAWSSKDVIIINGCESGKSWENHLVAIGVSSCPAECASCYLGAAPICSGDMNQDRIDHVLGQDGLAILAHPSSRGDDCWPGDQIETGWAKDKMRGLEGYQAIEIVTGSGTSLDEWEYILGVGRNVWGIAADDFHCRDNIGRGWIIVNSNSNPVTGQSIIENIQNGNFYSVRHVSGRDVPEFRNIQVLGGLVMVSFQRARSVRFIDCIGVRQENEVSRQAELDGEEHSVYYPDDLVGDYPMPNGYLRIEIEDSHGNVAYSQPLQVIGASGCPAPPDDSPTSPPCSKTTCKDLDCCTGYECRGDFRCYPRDYETP